MLSFSRSGILFILTLQNFLLSDLGSRINPTNVVWTQNVLLVSKYFNNISLSSFDNWSKLCSDIHNRKTQLQPLLVNHSNPH